jgi:hypothetical protein
VKEPNIVVNGKTLSYAQAMTVRVALESFAMDLSDHNCLGSDEVGRTIADGYRACISQIRAILYAR